MNTTQQIGNRVENISVVGRIVRFSVGAAMLAPLFFVSGPIGGFAILALLAILPVLCGIDGFCPLTAWAEKLSLEQHSNMSRVQRGLYAGVAISLIGSVFVLQGQALGAFVILPLLGIYPAIVAIFGVELFSECVSSMENWSITTVSRRGENVQRLSPHSKSHSHIAHAA